MCFQAAKNDWYITHSPPTPHPQKYKFRSEAGKNDTFFFDRKGEEKKGRKEGGKKDRRERKEEGGEEKGRKEKKEAKKEC